MKKRLFIVFLVIVGIIFACSYTKEEEFDKLEIDKLEIMGRWKVTHVWNIYDTYVWTSIEGLGEEFMYAEFGGDNSYIAKVNEEISYGNYQIIDDKIFCEGECFNLYYSFLDLQEESAIIELAYIDSPGTFRIKVEKVIPTS